MQELSAELRFELLDLTAERRLGNPELLGRATEAALGGDRHEVTQMTELHAHISRGIKIDAIDPVRYPRPALDSLQGQSNGETITSNRP